MLYKPSPPESPPSPGGICQIPLSQTGRLPVCFTREKLFPSSSTSAVKTGKISSNSENRGVGRWAWAAGLEVMQGPHPAHVPPPRPWPWLVPGCSRRPMPCYTPTRIAAQHVLQRKANVFYSRGKKTQPPKIPPPTPKMEGRSFRLRTLPSFICGPNELPLPD